MSKATVRLDQQTVKERAQSYLDYYAAFYARQPWLTPPMEYESVGERQENDCKMLVTLCLISVIGDGKVEITDELSWLFETDWTAKQEAIPNGNQ